eukprot:gb/GECG01003426.1/.p1 GENE.gb/GECG01003426.1/~~gb/GECG01003426.1/.p1  ORF type:complete len:338 (+),score=44.96 gb/GECG01003426.1/:1-1014(+)
MALLHDPNKSLDNGFFVFSPGFADGDYRLFEVTDEIADQVEAGKEVDLKAEGQEDLVMCTEDATYNVQRVESSNTNLLFRHDSRKLQLTEPRTGAHYEEGNAYEIVAECSQYYELEKTNGRLRKIRTLLEQRPYAGPTAEKNKSNGYLYSFEDLLDRVQASRREIEAELHNLDALCLGGYWRILSEQYLFQLVEEITLTIRQQGWRKDEINEKECVNGVADQGESDNSEFPKEVICHVLRSLVDRTDGSSFLVLDLEKVARVRARELLSSFHATNSEGRVAKDAFMEAWSILLQDMPGVDSFQLSLDLIKVSLLLTFSYGMLVRIYFFWNAGYDFGA